MGLFIVLATVLLALVILISLGTAGVEVDYALLGVEPPDATRRVLRLTALVREWWPWLAGAPVALFAIWRVRVALTGAARGVSRLAYYGNAAFGLAIGLGVSGMTLALILPTLEMGETARLEPTPEEPGDAPTGYVYDAETGTIRRADDPRLSSETSASSSWSAEEMEAMRAERERRARMEAMRAEQERATMQEERLRRERMRREEARAARSMEKRPPEAASAPSPAPEPSPPQPEPMAPASPSFGGGGGGFGGGVSVCAFGCLPDEGGYMGGPPPAPSVEMANEPLPVPAPVSVPPPAPAETVVTRYPTMDAPDRVPPREPFPLQVWLSEDLITPGVQVSPGGDAKVTEGGGLAMTLPDEPGRESWTLRAVLTAPGFELVEGNRVQDIVLPKKGDSAPALFMLAAKARGGATRTEKLRVTLWRDGAYVARLTREITVKGAEVHQADAAPPAPTRKKAAPVSIDGAAQVPDLTVHVLFEDPARLGPADVIVASPHFNPPSRLITAKADIPAEAADWLSGQYALVVEQVLAHAQGRQDRKRALALMRGVGREVYRRYAPKAFVEAFWELADDPDVALDTLQVFSNNPVLPWEIMRPHRDADGREFDFLGTEFLLGRWHADDAGRLFDRPLQSLPFDEVAALAPKYQGAERLPFQNEELARLGRLPGFREVPARYADLADLVERAPKGLLHFTGHGVVEYSPGGIPSYAIKLEDGALDLTTWRGMAANAGDAHPLYFFNACDLGQAASVANFVDGWAPAVLASGASGYIGGLWPLGDKAAAAFSRSFYGVIEDHLGQGPVKVAEALRASRRLFFETGDPTYLAYVFYGDVNLKLVRR